MAAPQLFNPSIIPTICDGNPQAINRLAQQTRQALQQIAQGNGSVFRFALTDTLSAGGSAPATIQKFDTSGFVSIGSGTVYDEEVSGFWSGTAGDEGWCTGRAGAPGSYSIIFMELSLHNTIVVVATQVADDEIASTFEIHRGITDEQIDKGDSGTVSRYTDGTNTDSGTNDTVYSDDCDIGSGKIVKYIKIGANFYVLSNEKTSKSLVTNIGQSTTPAIFATEQVVWIDSVATGSDNDKISLTSCPP